MGSTRGTASGMLSRFAGGFPPGAGALHPYFHFFDAHFERFLGGRFRRHLGGDRNLEFPLGVLHESRFAFAWISDIFLQAPCLSIKHKHFQTVNICP